MMLALIKKLDQHLEGYMDMELQLIKIIMVVELVKIRIQINNKIKIIIINNRILRAILAAANKINNKIHNSKLFHNTIFNNKVQHTYMEMDQFKFKINQ